MPPYTKKGLIDGLYDIFTTAVDYITKGIKTININHATIHEGEGFSFSQITPSLNFGEIKKFRVTSPITKFAHIKAIQITSEGATCRARVKKDVTIVNPGIIQPNVFINLNHNSSKVAESKAYADTVENPMTYNGGIEWLGVTIHGSSTNQSSSNGQFIQVDYLEFISKSNAKDYVIEVENIDQDEGTAYNVSINILFFEKDYGSSE